MRIVTFNVQHCRPADGSGREADVELTAQAIETLWPHALSVQELDAGLERSGGVHQADQLALLLGMHLFWVPAIEVGNGQYGHAVLSREAIDGGIMSLPGPSEPRVAFVGRTAGLSLVAAHLSTDAEASEVQLGVLVDTALSLPPPRVVLGDLNRVPEQLGAAWQAGFVSAGAAATYPRGRPNRQIDHILHDAGVVVRSIEAPLMPVSDHRPLVADVLATPS